MFFRRPLAALALGALGSIVWAAPSAQAVVVTVDGFDFELDQFQNAVVTVSGDHAFFGSDFDNVVGTMGTELGELVAGDPGDRITLGITSGAQGMLTLDYGATPITVGTGDASMFVVYEANGDTAVDPEGQNWDISFDGGTTWIDAINGTATVVDPGSPAATHNQIAFDMTAPLIGLSVGDTVNQVMIRNQVGTDGEHDPDFVFAAQALAGPSLTLTPDDTCLNAGEGTLTVDIDLANAPALIVGGQFFLEYDNSVLDFVSAAPGDAPFDLEIIEDVNETAGTIDYAVGVTGGGPGTMMDSTMAVLTFDVLVETCNTADLITFRANMPPTRITDMVGNAFEPDLIDLAALTIDQTDPVITCPSDVTVECDQSTAPSNTGQASATDNCDSSVDIAFSDSIAAGACPQESVITRTWTATDDCGNTSTCDQTITVVDTTAPVLGGTLDQVGPATLNHPGGGEANAVKYFLQPGSSFEGDLVLGTGVTYSVRMYGIDTSGLSGGTLVRLGLQDSAAGFTSFGVQAQLDLNGSGGHLLQSFETAPFNVPPDSSQGFNAGDVPGEFDMRFDFVQSSSGGPWQITPYYRLPGDTQWSLFFDTAQNGPWTTSNAFNITEGLVFIDLGGPNAGTVAHDGVELFCTPACPADITVNADAGFCSAVVDPGMAVAVDNCDPDPMVTAMRDDGMALNDPYPAGDTIITWTATDACGNSTQCMQTVTVNPVNIMIVDLELFGNLDAVVERCIEFELTGNDTAIETEIVELSLTGEASMVPVEIPCGDYDCVTVRDPLHTLASSVPLTVTGTTYEASVTGSDALIGGNYNGDIYVDILDFGVFVGQFMDSLPQDTDCMTPAPHADITGDGLVSTGDFNFIQIHFLEVSDMGCTSLQYAGGSTAPPNLPANHRPQFEGPLRRISVAELRNRGLHDLAVADLNHDKWLDQHDIAAFLAGARP